MILRNTKLYFRKSCFVPTLLVYCVCDSFHTLDGLFVIFHHQTEWLQPRKLSVQKRSERREHFNVVHHEHLLGLLDIDDCGLRRHCFGYWIRENSRNSLDDVRSWVLQFYDRVFNEFNVFNWHKRKGFVIKNGLYKPI